MAGLRSMRPGKLRRYQFYFSILLLSVLPYTGFGLDYTIKEVIEVGEADFVPFLKPIIWSPDGTRIAFTKGGVIKISDTLGKVQDIIKLDMPIHKWDWVSDSQIAAYMRTFTGNGPETIEELCLVNTTTNTKSVIHSFTVERNYREIPNKTISEGPYETVEGNKYYIVTTFNADKNNSKTTERRSFIDNKSIALTNDHLLRWSGDNLYKIRLDNTDSTWLAKRPASVLEVTGRTYFNNDKSHILIRDGIINLKDTSFIDLVAKVRPFPPNTVGCDFVWFSFCPTASEILFTSVCEVSETHDISNEIWRIGTYDYLNNDFRIIDTLINIPNCVAPSYSPNGQRIAFLANGKVYILDRKIP